MYAHIEYSTVKTCDDEHAKTVAEGLTSIFGFPCGSPWSSFCRPRSWSCPRRRSWHGPTSFRTNSDGGDGDDGGDGASSPSR